jgi:hypothetical protein
MISTDSLTPLDESFLSSAIEMPVPDADESDDSLEEDNELSDDVVGLPSDELDDHLELKDLVPGLGAGDDDI